MNNQCKSSIIARAIQIEGWFDEMELSLLIECVERAASRRRHYPDFMNVVEIGSFKGRSTIALGLAVVALSLDAVIYAIDPHEGLRSGRYDVIHHEGDTYNDFIRNVQLHGLDKVIRCIRRKSMETKLAIPISLILIDALHLYRNVKENFLHFEKNLNIGAFAAFHDYREEFPGVLRFVNSLLNTKKPSYVKVDQAHSLIILEKVS